MAWHLELLEVTSPSLAYIVLGGFVVAFSMISLLIKEKLYISEVVLGTAFGVLMGPHCANAFDPRSWGDRTQEITLEVMRIVLATGLFAIGVELPQSYLADHAKGLLVMVVPTMAFGWVVVAVVIYGLFEPLNYISALAVAACLTPTDPIICAAIVGGRYAIKHVPTNLRRILAAESAANDGMAYPFLSISIYLTVEASRRVAIAKWFLVGWLYEVILGTLIGAVLGVGFSKLMRVSHRRGFIDRESYVAQYLALALFTIGVASSLGTDDLLAAFAAGSAVSWDGYFNIQIENEVFSSVIDLVLNCGCFVYIGAWMPFADFNSPELGITPWRLILLFLVILVIRRIPALLVLYHWIPEISGWREALFSGHFGPMGVGAVFVSTLALSRLPKPQSPPQNQQEYLAASLQIIVAFIVLGSILIHGLSIPFFSFGRRIHSQTVSLTRTLTSRNNAVPEWLLGTRRMPSEAARAVDVANSVLQPDMEIGTQKATSKPGSAHIASDADVLVVSPDEVRDHQTPHFGEASFLEEPARSREASLRRRNTGMEALASPSGATVNENQNQTAPQNTTAAASDSKHPHALKVAGAETTEEQTLPFTTRMCADSVVDYEEDKPPSGVQTPVRSVHFPPSQ